MEILRQQHNMIFRYGTKGWTTFAAIAAGTLCPYDKVNRYLNTNSVHAAVLENNSWFSSILSKKHSSIQPAMADDAVRKILTEQQYTLSTRDSNISPVLWFETNHYNANNPMEDRHCECYLKLNEAYFFGIFDGHSGWHCAESLRLRLPLYISLALMNTEQRNLFVKKEITSKEILEYLSNPNDNCSTFKIPDGFAEKQQRIQSGSVLFAKRASDMIANFSTCDILKYAYLSMDRDITREAIPDGKCNEPIWSGLSGAVTIGAFIKGNNIYVANTGSCFFSIYIYLYFLFCILHWYSLHYLRFYMFLISGLKLKN